MSRPAGRVVLMSSIQRPELDLRAALRIIRERWLLVVIPVLLLTGIQLGLAMRATPMYSATTELLLQPKTTDSLSSGVGNANTAYSGDAASKVLYTEIRVLESETVADRAIAKLGFDAYASGGGDSSTDIMTVTARSADPQQAARIANVYADEYIKFRREQSVKDLNDAADELRVKAKEYAAQVDAITAQLANPALAEPVASVLRARRDGYIRQQQTFESRIDGLTLDASLKTGGASVLTKASEPSIPYSPRPLRSTVLGMFLGLMLGLGLALLAEVLFDRVKSKDDLVPLGNGKPVLGLIPHIGKERRLLRRRRSKRGRTGRGAQPDVAEVPPEAAEAYRSLRTAIQFLGVDRPLRVIQVTSSKSGEGKSTTISNLARTMCQAGLSVMVMDGDLRNPRLHEFFGIANEIGLSSVLAGTVGIAKASRVIDGASDLVILPSGPVPPNPAELLGSARAGEVVRAVLNHFDVLLIDGPPVLPVTDPIVISQLVDATLVVARVGKSTRDEVGRTMEMLTQANAPFIGFVLNSLPRHRRYGRGGYGRYGYGYGYGYGQQRRRGPAPVPTTKTSDVWVPDDAQIWTETGTTSARVTPTGSAADALARQEDAANGEAPDDQQAALTAVKVPNDPRELTHPTGGTPLG